MKITKLDEASTSRLVKNFTDDAVSFAIISGERPDSDRTVELKKDVRNLGLGFNEFIGRWVEDGISYDEKSLLIPNITYRQAYDLGQKYDQASIIYKDKYGIAEYCTTAFETYTPGDVVRKYNIDKDRPLNAQLAKSIFAGKIGGPASVLKKGGNKAPFNFSLHERVLINSRLGFTEAVITFDDKEELNESNSSRLAQHLTSDQFAIISPYRYENSSYQNAGAMLRLRDDVRKSGYGFIELESKWEETEPDSGEIIESKERSLLIPDCSRNDAIKLGVRYKQSTVISCFDGNCQEVCTREYIDADGNEHEPGDVIRTFNIDKNAPFNAKLAQDILDRRLSGGVSSTVKGGKNFSLKELYEVEHASPSTHNGEERFFRIF